MARSVACILPFIVGNGERRVFKNKFMAEIVFRSAPIAYRLVATLLLCTTFASPGSEASAQHLVGEIQPDDIAGIVRITCPASGTPGTAFKHRSGRLLAASTSVRSCSQVVVSLPSGRSVDAQVVASDHQADLAMLLPKEPVPGRALELSKQTDLSVGTSTAALGFPAGYIGGPALMIIGSVAGVTRMQVDDRQVTKLIVGGNYNTGLSGSPLFDKSGTVIGVLSGPLSPVSENALAALKVLKEERGTSFLWQQPGGTKVPLSQAQIVAIILEEILMQAHYPVGLATSLPDIRAFMTKNGVDP